MVIEDSNKRPFEEIPDYSEIAEEIGTLVSNDSTLEEWRKQAKIALLQSRFRYGMWKMSGLKDLPYAYLALAYLYDYFERLRPIMTLELLELQKSNFKIGIEPLFCKNNLREIKRDLIEKGILTRDPLITSNNEISDSESQEPVIEEKKPGSKIRLDIDPAIFKTATKGRFSAYHLLSKIDSTDGWVKATSEDKRRLKGFLKRKAKFHKSVEGIINVLDDTEFGYIRSKLPPYHIFKQKN